MHNLQPLFIREEILHATRTFFREHGFHEVLTPTLKPSLPLEPNLYAFTTEWNTIKEKTNLYLATSPEAYLKKMLAKGIGNCFAISKSFRNLESAGTKHFPEFLMLEWYRQDATYQQIMQDTQDLITFVHQHLTTHFLQTQTYQITFQDKNISLQTPWPQLSLEKLFHLYADIQITEILDDHKLFAVADKKGYSTQNTTWGALFDQIFLNEIEPHLPSVPLYLTDFPARISPLCTPRNDKPYLAQRFELYIANIEIANGNTENTDTKTIKQVFEQEKSYRQQHNILTPPIDQEFLESLEKMQNISYAGIGLGLDRLTMLFADCADIHELS